MRRTLLLALLGAALAAPAESVRRFEVEFRFKPAERFRQVFVAGSSAQHAAACAFGTAFMSRKRREAQRAAAARAAAEQAKERARAAAEVIPWLRKLGCRADEAHRAAARCEAIPDASLEERLRLALSFLQPAHRRVERSPVTPT